MNKKAIENTAICRWDDENECFIVESSMDDNIVGAAETEAEAWNLFRELLADAYEAYLEGRLARYDKPGRPAKGKARVNLEVKPSVKEGLSGLATDLQVSQGDAVDYLYSFYQAYKNKNLA